MSPCLKGGGGTMMMMKDLKDGRWKLESIEGEEKRR
jgi:hypothetical protein